MQINLNQLIIPSGHQLLLQDIDWPTLEQILDELGDHRAARLSYSDRVMEIMVPMAAHEDDKRIIGRFIEIILEELDLEYRALGSTTFKNAAMAQAVEPDECFYIQHESQIRGQERIDLTQDPPPDLALEIDLTSRTHFSNYERLGVPELWRYDGRQLHISLLQNGHYEISTVSRQFPHLALLEAIPRYVQESKQLGRKKTMEDFREWVRNCLNHS